MKKNIKGKERKMHILKKIPLKMKCIKNPLKTKCIKNPLKTKCIKNIIMKKVINHLCHYDMKKRVC
jgi:hypothetical protein